MTINRRHGFGHTLSTDPAGGTSWTLLAAVIDGFKGPNAKVDTPDITVLADTYKQFGKSQVDPGELNFSIMYDPDETTSTTLNTMLNSTSQTAPNWKITFPVGSNGSGTVTTETFKGFLSGMSREVKLGSKMVCEITIKVTGDSGYTHS